MKNFKGTHSGNFFDKRDSFSKTIPSFTIEGVESLGTSMGCLGSYCSNSLILTLCVLKLMYLVTKHELVITTTQILDSYGPKETLSLEDNELVFAFAV